MFLLFQLGKVEPYEELKLSNTHICYNIYIYIDIYLWLCQCISVIMQMSDIHVLIYSQFVQIHPIGICRCFVVGF